MRNPECAACPLHRHACVVCVWGEGPPTADLMIVGMAPGRTEDIRGRPFVGPAGEVLNECLAEAGLDRTAAYVTNAVKCFPGSRGKPSRSDIATCTELYLAGEIRRVRPRLIVAMGDVAMLALTNRSGVRAHRGTLLELRPGLGGECPVLVTYHPAAFLHSRDPNIRDAIRADLKTAARFLAGDRPSLSVHEVTALEADTLAVDVETDAQGRMIVGTLADGTGAYVPFTSSSAPALFASLRTRRLVGWNVAFDRSVLERSGVDVSRFEWGDPMIMKHCLHSGQQGRYSLLAAVLDELGRADAEWVATKQEVHAASDVPMERLVRYCAQDATYTAILYRRFRERLLQFPKLAKLYRLIVQASFVLDETGRTPVPLDFEYLRHLDALFVSRLRELERELASLAGLSSAPNLRSPKLLAQIMYEKLGLPIVKVTETGQPSTDRTVLMELMHLSPFVAALIRYRRFLKLHSAYVRRWLNNYSPDNPYCAQYSVTGTVTGRLSSDFQQLPRPADDPEIPNIRNAVRAPEGYVLLEADYNMLELRLVAWWSGEETMLRLLREGLDLHRHTAEQVFGRTELTTEERWVGKTANFLLIYGGGASKLAETLRLRLSSEQIARLCASLNAQTLLEASRAIAESWHRAFPGIREWHWREKLRIQERGYSQAPHGRIRWLPEAKTAQGSEREAAFRDGINHVIQSLASDLCLVAVLLSAPRLRQQGSLGPWPTHDSIFYVVPEGLLDESAAYLRRVMEVEAPNTLGAIIGRPISVPTPVELKAGRRLGETKPLDKEAGSVVHCQQREEDRQWITSAGRKSGPGIGAGGSTGTPTCKDGRREPNRPLSQPGA